MPYHCSAIYLTVRHSIKNISIATRIFHNDCELTLESVEMLTTKRLACVTPELNLRNPSCASDKAHNPPLLCNLRQISPEVQKRGISKPTRRTSDRLVTSAQLAFGLLPEKFSFSVITNEKGDISVFHTIRI